jgi:beta-glucanase (GH16 family)
MTKLNAAARLFILLTVCFSLLLLQTGSLSAQASASVWSLDPVFSDEFNYSGSPDPAKWNMENWRAGVVNQELQAYTDRLENVRVEDGCLIIEARKERLRNANYTSGRVNSAGKMDIRYGRIEVSAQLPEGVGMWPAIWAMPTDSVYGGWPDSGEIDIMENVGYEPDVVHATVHTEAYNHMIGTQKGASTNVEGISSAFHVYALEWTPTSITMSIDGNSYFTFYREPDAGSPQWPFDQPFYVILNIAVGGTWGGVEGVDPDIFPQEMRIDYVKMYSYDDSGMIPTTPSNLTITASSTSSITLAWESVNVGMEYVIYRYNADSGAYEAVGTTAALEYVVHDLYMSTTYYFKVAERSFPEGQISAPTAAIEATTAAPPPIPGQIEAEDYAAQSGTQTEETSDSGGGVNVSYIDAGDWLEYVVETAAAVDFTVDYRVASLSDGGAFNLVLVGETDIVLDTTSVPVTGDWQAWTTISSNPIHLPAGISRLRIDVTDSGWNLNWLNFSLVGPDTTAPAAPANLTANGGNGYVSLNWDDNTESDLAGYNVYRSLTSGSNYSQIASGLASSDYNDNAVDNGTTYYYMVTAVDTSSNESLASNEASATPEMIPEIAMHVNDIAMGSRSAGLNYFGQATVWVKDEADADIEGAMVHGTWSGATNETVSGLTGADGTVFFESSKVKNGGTFTLTVMDVVKSGFLYDPGSDVVSDASITVP